MTSTSEMVPRTQRICTEADCENKQLAKGLCRKHYASQYYSPGGSNARRCSEADCDQPYYAKGLCQKHYGRAAWTAKKPKKEPRQPRFCSRPDCDRPHDSLGLCRRHYENQRYHATRILKTRPKRFCAKPDCEERHHARDLCQAHYLEVHRSPNKPRVRKPRICSELTCTDPRHRLGLCDKHYQLAQTRRLREKACTAKRGANWDLENQATAILMGDRKDRGLRGTQVNSDEYGWLSDGQLMYRTNHEVYTSVGAPDPNIIEGRFFRAYNPLFGKRPSRANAADW